jgi:lipoprotein-releasing system permease protein
MNLKASFFVAWRNFLGRQSSRASAGDGPKGRNYLKSAVLGIALSLVPITLVLFVADGMIEGITARYLETSTYHLEASPFFSRNMDELEAAAVALRGAKGVSGAWAEMQGPAVALSTETAGALVRAIDPAFLEDPGLRRYLKPVAGELAFRRDNDVLLGSALAKKLGVKPGDLVTLLTAREGSSAENLNPRLSPLRVRAIVSTGYEELDALWAFVPLSMGERMLEPGIRRVFIGVKVADAFGNLEPCRSSVGKCLAGLPGQEPGLGWSVASWGELERNLLKSFSTTRALLLLVMALVVAVAAVNVGSALIMLVLERRKDIAILKSCGSSPSQIAAIFVFLGLLTGILGTAIGLSLGCVLSFSINYLIQGLEYVINIILQFQSNLSGNHNVSYFRLLNPAYYLESIPVKASPGGLSAIALFAILLSVLASLLPARRAARLSPLEILRKT